jgi:hypothetical protein
VIARLQRLPVLLALLLAATITALSFVYSSKVGGGSDSYGYLSEAELFLNGQVSIDQSFTRNLPWAQPRVTFTPLGYRLSDDVPGRIVPVYPPGFPLLLAGAKKIAGDSAKFWIVPISAGLLVFAAFGIGRRLASDAAGLIAAWLVATSPSVLNMSVQTMSDIPAAGVLAAALWLSLADSGSAVATAGLLSGLGLLIRPNLAPLAAVLVFRFLIESFNRSTRQRALVQGALFSAGVLAGAGVLAAMNHATYGAALRSGYGSLNGFFAAEHIRPNITNYLSWFVESQTWIALLGFAAIFVPSRRLWPAASRRHVIVVAAFTAVLWGMYFVYMVFDVWWYLRFLLASWPSIMAGTGALAVLLMRWRPAVTRPLVTAGVVALGCYGLYQSYAYRVFDIWRIERRFIAAGKIAERLTVPNSVIITGQHSGSLRYYAGRMTMRYDMIEHDDVDRVVDWLKNQGVHVYLLVERWELEDIDTRYDRTRTMDAIETAPLVIFNDPGEFWLFDLSHPRRPGDAIEMATGVDRGLRVPGPASPPRLVFR